MMKSNILGLSNVTKELASALENEVEAEKRLETENLGGSEVPTITGFQISTNDAEVRLTKKYGNEKYDFIYQYC